MLLTPAHLAIVMEYAAGGELFGRICKAGRFNENEVIMFMVGFFLKKKSCNFKLYRVQNLWQTGGICVMHCGVLLCL